MAYGYTKLADTDLVDQEANGIGPRPSTRRGRVLLGVKNLLVYTTALFGLYNLVCLLRLFPQPGWDVSATPMTTMSCDCGTSIAEALSRSCKFDSLAMAWLPPHCRDDALTAEFEAAGDGPEGQWMYWADTEHTELMTIEEVAAMGDDSSARVHMGTSWHRVHCVFYWRKQYRMPLAGKSMEPRSDNEHHIMHCGKVFEEPGYGTISGVALNTDHH